MAVLVSRASGNLLDAATWAQVDTASYLNLETGTTTLVTTEGATSRSAAFTPTANEIDAIGIKFGSISGSTGVLNVQLFNITTAAVIQTVVITPSALPQQGTVGHIGWLAFKISPHTPNGTDSYRVSIWATSGLSCTAYRDSTAANWSRFLRLTATAAPVGSVSASPDVGGDDLIICGEYFQTASPDATQLTPFTVSMNETAATDYGSATTSTVTPAVAISNGGTLTWPTSSSPDVSYRLRLSGYLNVFSGGTLSIGTSGAPVPRTATAILEFDCKADANFGLRLQNGSTCNIYGQSRTAGKDVVACKLAADVPIDLVNLSSLAGGSSAAFTGVEPYGGPYGGAVKNDQAAYASFTESASTTIHGKYTTGAASVTNITQTFRVWLSRGTGTNNRYCRLEVCNTPVPDNGFYAEVDLQAGTIGSCTAIGDGTAISSSISAFGSGYICTITGKASAAAQNPIAAVLAMESPGVVSYTGTSTNCFNFYGPVVVDGDDTAITGTLMVDTDTGWLAGDQIAVASTELSELQNEMLQLASDAGASTLALALHSVFEHSGTYPTQAEIINLTRNVKIRSVTPAFYTHVAAQLGATSTWRWAELSYLGGDATGQRGIEVNTTTGSFDAQYCSVRDCESNGFYVTGTTANNFTLSNNVFWNLNDDAGATANAGINLSAATSGTNWTTSNNIVIGTRGSNGTGFLFTDLGGTVSGNVAAGNGFRGFTLNDTVGVIADCTSHSNGSAGFTIIAATIGLTMNSITAWLNDAAGITSSLINLDLTIDGATLFGNTDANINLTGVLQGTFINIVSNDHDNGSAEDGMSLSGAIVDLKLIDCDFSTVQDSRTVHSNTDIEFLLSTTGMFATIIAINTNFGAVLETKRQADLSAGSYIAMQNRDQTASFHKFQKNSGSLITDRTIFNTTSPSLRVTPVTVLKKTDSAMQTGLLVPVDSGATVSVSVYVRKSLAAEGVEYDGAAPRLILKANTAVGISGDVVLDTAAAANGTWEQLTGTTAVATSNGVMEFVVDCDGASGCFVNVDDWAVA